MAVCISCKKTEDSDQLWTCDQCQRKICTSCSKLSASEIKCMELKKQRTLKFYCKICREANPSKDLMDEIKKLIGIVKQQTGKIDVLTEEVKGLRKKVEQFEERNIKQNSCIETVVTEMKNDFVNSNLSYADATIGSKLRENNIVRSTEPVLIVKPKENQKSDITRKEIKEKIDPSKLGAGVSGMKEVSNGQVVIRCENKKDLRKIESKIQEEMSNNYEIKSPSLKRPEIKIVGIDEDDADTDEGLIQAIIDQNLTSQIREEENFHLKVIKRIKEKSRKKITVILEADPKTHRILINRNKIYVGWSRGKPYDYVYVVRCYKCLGFNHFAKDCNNNKVCYKCSLEHQGECKADHDKCINCSKAIEKYKIKIKDNHNALDLNCPCYIRTLNSAKRRVNYSEHQ